MDLRQIIKEQYFWIQKHQEFETSYFTDLTDTEIDELIQYLKLIKQWNIKVDLVSPQSDEMLISRHLIDCVCAGKIVASQNIPADLDFVDVGSGAGLPGIILAVLDKGRVVHLVEPRQKRCLFLNEVKSELKLENIRIHEHDFLAFSRMTLKNAMSSNVGLIISRALGRRDEYLQISQKLIEPIGFVVEMLAAKFQTTQNLFIQNIFAHEKAYNFLLPPDSAKRSLVFRKN
jgi:16S rRNA (guanine(527)-N(7))-methyltransferase RsmG